MFLKTTLPTPWGATRIREKTKMKQFVFIGGGHITHIMLDRFLKTGVINPESVIVSDPAKKVRENINEKYKITTVASNKDALAKADYIFINVLPRHIATVIEEIKEGLNPVRHTLLSVVSGIPMARYTEVCENLPVCRLLPNPPSKVGQGVIAMVFNDHVNSVKREKITSLLETLGECFILEEGHINTVTALSSPASVCLFFQSLIDAGVYCGIDQKTSLKIARQTILGVMATYDRGNKSPHELLDQAASPGGISVESLLTLEKYGFKAGIIEAIYKGMQKASTFTR